MSEKLCVVMPVYNEEDAIVGVLQKWSVALIRLGIDFVIRPYNDGSRDSSLKVMREYATAHPEARVEVRDKVNGGHGHTILTGYRDAAEDGFDWIFQVDSDDEMGPEKFEELWSKRADYDFLVGIRDGRIQALPRKVISFVSRCCVKLFYGCKTIWDVNTPYRLMRTSAFRELLGEIPITTFAPNVILSGMVARRRLRFYEICVPQHDRTTGEVSIKKWKLLKAAMKSFVQTIAFSFDRERIFAWVAVAMGVLALYHMTGGLVDWSFAPVRRMFGSRNDFDIIQACLASSDHYHPDGVPIQDAPYSALCYQIMMLFPNTVRGFASFAVIAAAGYLLGVGILARARRIPVWAAVLAAASTSIFVHAIERGNPIFLAAAAVCVFLAWYDDEIAWKRVVAAAMLALAVVLKVSPALFGVLYLPHILKLKTWRWREISFAAIIGVVFLVVPFFLFGFDGWNAFQAWVENARENGRWYALCGNFGLPACFGWLNTTCEALGHPIPFMGMAASRLPSACFGLMLLVIAFIAQERVMKMYLLVAAMVLIPGNSFFYCLLYFIPVVWIVLKERPLWEGLLMVLLIFQPIGFSVCGQSLWIPLLNLGVMGFGAYYSIATLLAVAKKK